MPIAITRGVAISVEPRYLPERSNPERNYYFFTYHVIIHNQGDETRKEVHLPEKNEVTDGPHCAKAAPLGEKSNDNTRQ